MILGWRLWFAWALSHHSGRPEEVLDLTTPLARDASPGIVNLLDLAQTLGLRGEA